MTGRLEIVACRPVDWSHMGPLSGESQTPVYPGSVERDCDMCRVPVWVGPKQQEVPPASAVTICFLCATELLVRFESYQLVNLGNTYQRKDGT